MSKKEAELRALRARAGAIRLPASMRLGAATAAYQIEGAATEDGKGESIWDRFAHTPGKIQDGSNGDIACDHYRRWAEDIALMKALGLDAYRFSIAWPRVIPDGRGRVNPAGLAYYDRLTDALLREGIEPFVTLYHWDLPQALQDRGGGWLNRDIVEDFSAYTDLMSRRLGDRVKRWTTFNELWNFTWNGYAFGEDAPGLHLGPKGALAASHHALLAHGAAVPIIRANAPGASVGIVFDVNHVSPASADAQDIAAATRFDGAQNRWYLDAVFNGRYPQDMLDLYGPLLPEIRGSDMEAIAVPLDYLGINVYRRSIMAAGSELPPLNFKRITPGSDFTYMGWEVHPESLYDILAYVHENYRPPELIITENGSAYIDHVESDDRILDIERARYLVTHLEQAARAIEDGIPLTGYFAWTLMDNFEWAAGFDARFGLVHVDFATQRRLVKASGQIYASIIDARDHASRGALKRLGGDIGIS